MIAFVNDLFVQADKAGLRLNDLSIQRGYAVFDFFRTKNYKPLFLEDYLDRFFASGELLRLKSPKSKAEVKDIIRELIRQNDLPEAGIKLMLTGGYSPDGYTPAEPNFIVTQHEIQLTSPEKFAAGIKVITYPHQRELPTVKSTDYLMGVWLQEKLRQEQAADVLYHNNGIITEFPRSNVFVVSASGRVITPSENILSGITRKKILELGNGSFDCAADTITIEELKNAREVFMTSTTKRILPVVQVDDTIIWDGKPGAVTTKISQAFLDLEDNYIHQFTW